MRLLKCSSGDDEFLPPPRKLCDSWCLCVCRIFSRIEEFLIVNIFIICIWSKAQGQGALIIEQPMLCNLVSLLLILYYWYWLFHISFGCNMKKWATWRRSMLSKCFSGLKDKFDLLLFPLNLHVWVYWKASGLSCVCALFSLSLCGVTKTTGAALLAITQMCLRLTI